MRRFRESILKNNDNVRVSIIRNETMDEYDDDLVENMIVD